MEPEADLAKKSHRERHSGRKAEKKKAKAQPNQNEDLTAQQRNPKAFAINSAIRAERRFRRKKDMETKKQHVPLVDRNPIEPPPIMIAVVGPPRVGKSTLINNLIKLFTRSPLSEIKGPVTIVTGKKRRITFVECNNDVNSMIDLAKVADLVLLICDASVGFEMEVFEFLNICQVHGMPKIMGVLNHLDMLKTAKLLKARKKELKHRFWTEVYPGAKLFYLSGIVRDEYLRNEVKNLGRFISVMKFRPLTWRQTHSYLLGDRYEDLTPLEAIKVDPKCDRNICLYGYVRGIPIKKNGSVHLAGLGDLKIHDLSFLPDPCPLPDQIKKRALIEKEKTVYAPFSGVGGIVYDKDAVYVESESQNRNEDNKFDADNSDVQVQHFKKLNEIKVLSFGEDLIDEDLGAIQEKEEEEALDDDDKAINEEEDEKEEEYNESQDEEEEEDDDDQDEDDEKKLEKYAASTFDFVDAIDVKWKNLETIQAEKEEEDEDEDEEGTLDDEVMNEEEDEDEVEEDKESQDEDEDDDDDEKDEDEEEDVSSKKRKDDDIGLSLSAELEKLRKQNSQPKASRSKEECEIPKCALPKKVKQYKEKQVKIDGRIRRLVVFDDAQSLKRDEVHSITSNIVKKLEARTLDNVSSIKKKSGEDDNDTDEDDEEEIGEEDEEESAEEEDNDENGDEESEGDDSSDDDHVKWKENLMEKARDAYLDRKASVKNLMKLVYGVFDSKSQIRYDDENVDKEDEEEEEELGDLFTRVSRTQRKQKIDKDSMNLTESSLAHPWNTTMKDWLLAENKASIANCFVTGSWKKSEDANDLLRLDDDAQDDDEDMFGDFEDFETGTKYSAKRKLDDGEEEKSEEGDGKKSKPDENDESVGQSRRDALAEKKKKLKERFNADYDNGESDSKYYDDLKSAAEKQAALNKTVFENMPDEVRVQIEGCRPGMYVRIEFQRVPCEFVENFDPSYPLVIGALNMGEENIGYVNVRIKKHRWYKKILKTNDPIIVSMGWRRFQTLPIFSKLEDDLKFRYLKYTPEHLSCNAHFWGPMTPQGTGFLALQSVESNPEMLSKQGFRIAATGTVQELDKSTRIMKKLKLIGHPMKIYKKTAFIKDMFTSALEVSRFEGARLLTTSKIRGQIKKAISKPQGCFRATFEDKILLSDIVFLRTWYQVDVQQYYNPVATLLLPPELKNSWQGVRTCGEIKKANNIQVVPNQDNLYTEVVRQVKPFKPLVVPAKLQKALPYRDKPKNSVKFSERKKKLDRVAVIREPHEQKIATLMKRVKTTYQHKQAKLKEETKARLQKHREDVEAREAFKDKKLKQKKKEVFRKRSKNKTN